MKPKSDRKKAVAYADKWFSLFIRARDGRCVTCGSSESLQCGHLFTRAAYSTRWDERNAFCQCAGCNLRHEHDSSPLTAYYLSRFGEDAYHELHRKHKQTVKLSTAEIRAIGDSFKERANEMNGDFLYA